MRRRRMSDVVTRFAPSPTGYLHLGHVHSALVGWRARARRRRALPAAHRGHRPRRRCRAGIRRRRSSRTCAWLGLDWDGPVRRAIRAFRRLPRGARPARRVAGCSIPASAPARDDPGRDRARRRRAAWAGRTALSRHLPRPRRRRSGRRGSAAARPSRCGSMSARAVALAGRADRGTTDGRHGRGRPG